MSHKTKTTFKGPQYDLHAAARGWIERHLAHLIAEQQIFFELTKEEKLARIADFGCELFIDDLPEILLAPAFPKTARRLLFDPQNHHQDKRQTGLEIFSSWFEVPSPLVGEGGAQRRMRGEAAHDLS